LLEHLRPVARTQHDVPDPGLADAGEQVTQVRRPGCREHRLRRRKGERAQPGALAPDQHDGVDLDLGRHGNLLLYHAPLSDKPRAGAAPTRRLEAQGGRRRQQPTTPLNTPAPTTPMHTPLARRPQAEPITSPLKEPEPEDTGLVPTVTQNNGKSDLSRRLDG